MFISASKHYLCFTSFTINQEKKAVIFFYIVTFNIKELFYISLLPWSNIHSLGWKAPQRSSDPNFLCKKKMSQHSVQTSFKSVQIWGFHHFSEEIIPMGDYSHREKFSSSVQLNLSGINMHPLFFILSIWLLVEKESPPL